MDQKICKAIRPLLQRFSDGELSSEEANPVRAHLMDCLDCRSIVGEVYSLRKFFHDDSPVNIPEGFSSKVAAKAFLASSIQREDASLLPFVRKLAALAAGGLLILGLSLVFYLDWKQTGGLEVRTEVRNDLDREIEAMKKTHEAHEKVASPKNSKEK